MSVYFISDHSGAIKIGYTANIDERIADLQVSHSRPLKLIVLCPGPFEFERRLHRILNSDRLMGEWFSPSPQVNKLISILKSRPESLGSYLDAYEKASLAETKAFCAQTEDLLHDMVAHAIDMRGGIAAYALLTGSTVERVSARYYRKKNSKGQRRGFWLDDVAHVTHDSPEVKHFVFVSMCLWFGVCDHAKVVAAEETAPLRRRLEDEYYLPRLSLDAADCHYPHAHTGR